MSIRSGGGHGLNGVGATDRLRSRLGKAEVFDLTFLDQLLHRSRHVLDRHVRVDAVLIEEIDDIDLQPFRASLRQLP